jgi:hypothetical protein
MKKILIRFFDWLFRLEYPELDDERMDYDQESGYTTGYS